MPKQLMSPGSGAPSGRGLNWSEGFRRLWNRWINPALPATAIALAAGLQISASDLKFKLEQTGADVLMTVSGSTDIPTLTANGWPFTGGGNGGGNAFIRGGSTGGTLGFGPGGLKIYTGSFTATPPPGSVDIPYFNITPYTGTVSAMFYYGSGQVGQLQFHPAYNGGSLSDTVTFSNKTLTGVPRSYVWGLPNGDTVTIEIIPGISLSSTTAVSGSSASGNSVDFTATFSKDATGVDTADFSLTKTGTADGTISSVTAVNASTYTVSVTGVVGTGTLRLDLKSSGTGIKDTGSPAQDISGGFTSGTPFSVDHNPVVTATPTSRTFATGHRFSAISPLATIGFPRKTDALIRSK